MDRVSVHWPTLSTAWMTAIALTPTALAARTAASRTAPAIAPEPIASAAAITRPIREGR
jgi:hypothetical protein